MSVNLALQAFTILCFTRLVLCIPPNDKDLYEEARIGHKRRRPPCVGKSDPEGRFFLDWHVQHINVDYNYNYNINCGGGGGNKPGLLGGGGGNKPGLLGGGGNKPGLGGGGGHHQGGGLFGGHQQGGGLLGGLHQGGGLLGGLQQGGGLFGGHQQDGGGNKPDGGSNNHGGGGGLFGGNGPLAGIFQSQSQGIFGNGGIFNGQGLGGLFNGEGIGSLLPQGGLFNGQGISSLFENGLFSNIFNRPPSAAPIIPVTSSPIITTPKPTDVQDPDDIIYNDEKPVHEDHDDVVPDVYNYNKPGQYLVAYNPVFGGFVQDLSDFNPNKIAQDLVDINPNKIIRRINRGFNKYVVKPLAHLLRR